MNFTSRTSLQSLLFHRTSVLAYLRGIRNSRRFRHYDREEQKLHSLTIVSSQKHERSVRPSVLQRQSQATTGIAETDEKHEENHQSNEEYRKAAAVDGFDEPVEHRIPHPRRQLPGVCQGHLAQCHRRSFPIESST